MAKTRVSIDIKSIESQLRKFKDLSKISIEDLRKCSNTIVGDIKDNASKGISPIKGNKRFPRYKNPESYPDKLRKKFPNKRRRPVNLFLSGRFLNTLKARIQVGKSPSIRVGFFNRDSKLKERGHREGANGQPKRPLIPQNSEQFNKKIVDNFRKSFIEAFKNSIS